MTSMDVNRGRRKLAGFLLGATAPLLILPSSAAGAVGIGGVGGRIRKWEFGIRKEGSRREAVRSDRIHAVWTRVF